VTAGWVNTITPDPDIACRPGWCLEYVRKTFGQPARYDNATDAWEGSTAQHRDREFPAAWVPVWYGVAGVPEGHVVLRAPDGSVYSTTDPYRLTPVHHPSLADLEARYAAAGLPLTYRGWTEDIAGTPVVKYSGGLAAQGTTTPKAEEEFMGGKIDAGQANDIVEQTVERLLDRMPDVLDNRVRIHPIQAESIVRATTGRVVAILRGDKIDAGQADDIARASAEYVREELAAQEAGK